MLNLNRMLIGVCAPSYPELADDISSRNPYITPLPEFSHILRFNKITYSYYQLDGRAVPNVTEIMAENIPIIRYTENTDNMYEIVKFVSREEFPENSVMVYQYNTPMEICTQPANGVGYFYINMMFSFDLLTGMINPRALTEEEIMTLCENRYMLNRYLYTKQCDTLILGYCYEKFTREHVLNVVFDWLYKIDTLEKATGPTKDGGLRYSLFECIANKEDEELRRKLHVKQLQSGSDSCISPQQECSETDQGIN